MRKKTILAIAFLGLFLVTAGTCLAQELMSWEWDVYYDVVQEYYTSSIPKGEEYLDRVKSKIANKHGISLEKLEDIFNRGLNKEPTQREWDISEEKMNQGLALEDNASDYDYDRMYKRVADKYGITLLQLYEIDYRTMHWLLTWGEEWW